MLWGSNPTRSAKTKSLEPQRFKAFFVDLQGFVGCLIVKILLHLVKGNKIPDEDILDPSGYHYLVSIETPNPKVVVAALKRAGRLAAKTFDDLVIAYNNKCATCGIEQGKKDPRMNVIVKLQQGHMNPRKDLTLDNTIPQCQYCNQTYQDYFQFNEWGRVIAVNNPEILLKSPVDVQDEMIAVLLRERQMKSETLNDKDGD